MESIKCDQKREVERVICVCLKMKKVYGFLETGWI
jgi:hypothetical protein